MNQRMTASIPILKRTSPRISGQITFSKCSREVLIKGLSSATNSSTQRSITSMTTIRGAIHHRALTQRLKILISRKGLRQGRKSIGIMDKKSKLCRETVIICQDLINYYDYLLENI
jgi:hypothetical protein